MAKIIEGIVHLLSFVFFFCHLMANQWQTKYLTGKLPIFFPVTSNKKLIKHHPYAIHIRPLIFHSVLSELSMSIFANGKPYFRRFSVARGCMQSNIIWGGCVGNKNTFNFFGVFQFTFIYSPLSTYHFHLHRNLMQLSAHGCAFRSTHSLSSGSVPPSRSLNYTI